MVHLADTLCRRLGIGSGGDAGVPVPDPCVWQALEIAPESVESWLGEVPDQMTQVQELLHLVNP